MMLNHSANVDHKMMGIKNQTLRQSRRRIDARKGKLNLRWWRLDGEFGFNDGFFDCRIADNRDPAISDCFY